MIRLAGALVLLLLGVSPSLAQQSLVGTYKLVSIAVEIDGKETKSNSHGHFVLTPTGAFMFYTGDKRKFGTTVEEKAALYDSLVTWSGVYRMEGDKLIYTVDASWVENLNGQTLVLHCQLSGNRLTTTTDPRPWPMDPSKKMVNRRVWEKIE